AGAGTGRYRFRVPAGTGPGRPALPARLAPGGAGPGRCPAAGPGTGPGPGYTSLGPHRADWQVDYPALPGREALSRGQEKLTALACVLAQARAFAADRGEWPLVCLDDLASELDRSHLEQALTAVLASGAQVLLTATERPELLRGPLAPQKQFHVEQGRVRCESA